jgi:hypothetical protein
VAEDVFRVIGSCFVEAVHVELADETVHFVVAKVAGQDDLLKLIGVFDGELVSRGSPEDNFVKLFVLSQAITYVEDLEGF